MDTSTTPKTTSPAVGEDLGRSSPVRLVAKLDARDLILEVVVDNPLDVAENAPPRIVDCPTRIVLDAEKNPYAVLLAPGEDVIGHFLVALPGPVGVPLLDKIGTRALEYLPRVVGGATEELLCILLPLVGYAAGVAEVREGGRLRLVDVGRRIHVERNRHIRRSRLVRCRRHRRQKEHSRQMRRDNRRFEYFD